MHLAVIDYNAGNIRSVLFALERLGVSHELTADPARIRAADRVIFPGVGAAGSTMAHLNRSGLADVIRGLRQPTFGICVGMQLLCGHSEENDTPCLGIFPDRVKLFRPLDGAKVPHMGWNTITVREGTWVDPALDGAYCYYVHSYFVEESPFAVATGEYGGTRFSTMLRKDNFFAAQFHPEKSAAAGARILQCFLDAG
ncbi:MAG: imidazole glycerol phosphate synthase subunit HisH [Saprospiraceae bacterium]